MMVTGLKQYESDFLYGLMMTFANPMLGDADRERCVRKAFGVYSDEAKLQQIAIDTDKKESGV
jgi:hypothetical protein